MENSTTYQVFPELIPIGYVQKTIGFKGNLQILLDCPIKDKTDHPPFLWFLQDGKPVPFHVEEFNVLSQGSIQIRLEDLEDEQEALSFKNLTCFVEEGVYDDYFDSLESYDYLIGFSVYDKEAGALGEVQDVLENDNGHDNLVIIKDKQEIMIPFVEPIIQKLDEDSKRIEVNLPEGLLDLYINK